MQKHLVNPLAPNKGQLQPNQADVCQPRCSATLNQPRVGGPAVTGHTCTLSQGLQLSIEVHISISNVHLATYISWYVSF